MLKRLFDMGLSFVGIMGSLPLWIIIAIAIKLEDWGPVFYSQDRIGKDGKIFKVLKFRSMVPDAEKDLGPVQATEGDARITKVGALLRATAMDELPQLVNIFKGDMSFVGPRALRPGELEVKGNPKTLGIEDIPGYKERTRVIPGLTGVTQIYAPKDAPREKKFRYDMQYVKSQSFLLDLKLILLSFLITFKGKWESREKKI